MELPATLDEIEGTLDILLVRIPGFLIFIPRIIQAFGLLGCIYHGFYLLIDQRMKLRGKKFIRSAAVILIGLIMEYSVYLVNSMNP